MGGGGGRGYLLDKETDSMAVYINHCVFTLAQRCFRTTLFSWKEGRKEGRREGALDWDWTGWKYRTGFK